MTYESPILVGGHARGVPYAFRAALSKGFRRNVAQGLLTPARESARLRSPGAGLEVLTRRSLRDQLVIGTGKNMALSARAEVSGCGLPQSWPAARSSRRPCRSVWEKGRVLALVGDSAESQTPIRSMPFTSVGAGAGGNNAANGCWHHCEGSGHCEDFGASWRTGSYALPGSFAITGLRS